MSVFVSSAPHVAKRGSSTRNIMLDVVIALMPACLASILIFGHLVAINLVLCVVFCMVFELLFGLIRAKKWNFEAVKNSSVWDFSSAITGILLALNLPTYVDVFGGGMVVSGSGVVIFSPDMIFVCFLGSLVAIVVVKMLFGGIGKNFANPAMVGRVFLFLCFTLAAKDVAGYIFDTDFAITGATALTLDKTATANINLLHLFLGTKASAAVGEASVVAILLGYVYLCIRRVIDFRLPLILVGFAALFAFLFEGLGDLINGGGIAEVLKRIMVHVLSGGLVFGAVFMATDYATSPNTFLGSVVFALGIALFTMLIRVFGAYPEGFSFALIIMNILVPIIDRTIKPKPFGTERKKLKEGGR